MTWQLYKADQRKVHKANSNKSRRHVSVLTFIIVITKRRSQKALSPAFQRKVASAIKKSKLLHRLYSYKNRKYIPVTWEFGSCTL